MAWRDNKALAGVLAILAIAAIAYAVVSFMPKKLKRDLMCDKCQAVSSIELAASASYPVACPKCSAVAAHPCIKLNCMKEKKQYTMIEKGDGGYKCPNCGGEMTP